MTIITITTLFTWSNGIAILGFVPLIIDLIKKIYKKSKLQPDKRKEIRIFDGEFKQDFAIGFLIALFTIFQNNADETKSHQSETEINSLRDRITSIHSEDSLQSINDRRNDRKASPIASMRQVLQSFNKMQEIINRQEKTIDSLNKAHAEKHLTDDEKKDILKKITAVNLQYGLSNKVPVVLTLANGSNGATFSKELQGFLKEKSFNVFEDGMYADTETIYGYRIEYWQNEILIIVGYFKL